MKAALKVLWYELVKEIGRHRVIEWVMMAVFYVSMVTMVFELIGILPTTTSLNFTGILFDWFFIKYLTTKDMLKKFEVETGVKKAE